MSNVVEFPVVKREIPAEVFIAPSPSVPQQHQKAEQLSGFAQFVLLRLLRFLRICLVLAWPLLSKILAIDVSFQFFRAAFRWHSVGSLAAVPFISHFLIFALLTLVVQSAAKK